MYFKYLFYIVYRVRFWVYKYSEIKFYFFFVGRGNDGVFEVGGWRGKGFGLDVGRFEF